MRGAKEKEDLNKRLNRVEGQIRGIQKMISEDRYCLDVLTQIQAARAALTQIGLTVIEGHAKGCLVEAIQQGDVTIVDELLNALRQFTK